MTRRALLASMSLGGVLRGESPTAWPAFRGPGARGVSGDDARLPESWSSEERILWRTTVPGRGWSSPIVWGNRAFVTTAVSGEPLDPVKKGFFGSAQTAPVSGVHRWEAYALDFGSGKISWRSELHAGAPETPRHPKNSYASETPATDGEHIYVHFGHLGTYCLDWNGKLVWSKRWPPHAVVAGLGTGTSPALYRDRLYIANDNLEGSSLTALDKSTGEEIWRVERDEIGGWATPYVWQNEQRTAIVVSGSNRMRSYDLDGGLLWEFRTTEENAIPTPFSAHGLLYSASAFGPVYVFRPGAEGDVSLAEGETSNEAIVWSLPKAGPYNTSPLVYGDFYYTLLDRGFLTCHEAQTGREVYGKQRIDREAGAFTASPWAYNGKIFCLSEDGRTFVVEAGPDFKVLRSNPLGELAMATPAIAQGSLLLRTELGLYRIGSEQREGGL